MDNPYGLPADFRHFTASSTRTDHNQVPFSEPFSVHRNLTVPAPTTNTYQSSFPFVSGGGLGELASSDHHHQFSGASDAASCALMYGSNIHHHHHHLDHDQTLEMNGVWNDNNIGNIDSNNEANNSRWPRQETLTLLEIRSRLNSKFKDTNQKAPLWDEVSRIMAEEHGYHRSGKKCKEKFENLYKYYKKTKEGKAGRQDGKHYRFFRQLEAIYGDQSTSNQSSALFDNPLLYDHHTSCSTPNLNRTTNYNQETLSFSINSTECETSSSENNDDDLSAIACKMNNQYQSMKRKDQKMKGKISHSPSGKSSSWKAKVENFVDEQIKKIIVTQESWMEKMLKSIIDKEEERLAKEEEWRKQEAAKLNREVSEFWAKEKAWVEARDAALMGVLKQFRGGNRLELPSFPKRVIGKDHIYTSDAGADYRRWGEEEISSLIELRSNLEETFQGKVSEDVKGGIWAEIASKMACLGYEHRSALECKEKWESVSVYVRMTSECEKKRKEDFKGSANCYFDDHHVDQLNLKQEHHHHHAGLELNMQDEGLSPSTSNVGTTQMHPHHSCFHLLFGEGENLWEKYGGLKLSKLDKTNQ